MSIEHSSDGFRILGPDETAGIEFGCVVFEPITGDYSYTPKETEELVAMSYGLSSSEYALEAFISYHTSRQRRKIMRQKSGTKTGAETIVNGFIKGDLEYMVERGYESPRLTHRRLQVLGYIASGYRSTEIARKIYLSVDTLQHHLTHANWELRAENRNHAMRRCFETGTFRLSTEFEPGQLETLH